jgi:hypothetical protein
VRSLSLPRNGNFGSIMELASPDDCLSGEVFSEEKNNEKGNF